MLGAALELDQDVVEFDVTVHYSTDFGQVAETSHHVSDDVAGFDLVEKESLRALRRHSGAALLDERAEVALVAELQEQVQVVRRLQGPVVSHDVWVRLWDQS